MLPPPPQLNVGQTKWITIWAADPHVAGSRVNIADISLNRESWPGLAVGDVIRVSSGKTPDSDGVLYIVPPDDSTRPPLNQVCFVLLSHLRLTYVFRSLSLVQLQRHLGLGTTQRFY